MHAIVSRSRRFSIAIEPRAEPCDKAFSKFFWLETSGVGDRTPSLTTIHKTLIKHASNNTCASIYCDLRRLVDMARLCAIEAVTAKLQQRGGRLYSDELRPMYKEKPWLKEVIGDLRQFMSTVPELFHVRTDAACWMAFSRTYPADLHTRLLQRKSQLGRCWLTFTQSLPQREWAV